MSLFDLRDVCIVIRSLTTLDVPMVVDLTGIYVLKGPYCTLTMTDWFLQALSVIPRGSWGDVARRFTMIRWPQQQHQQQVAQQSGRQRFRPRGQHFKKKSGSGSSGSGLLQHLRSLWALC
ncbi:hypothetical protein F511_13770 [Dorcoceras hygrometricum]|uniref:Uncharacterized protein n=1 Tax=Dorcoceras hygrometricum TaxID=472368 RepID=A0A2Z7D5E7_9LAMI|nr:hypothetical protein F511_13770 [Dorcoceras hygrometricum]